MRKINLIFLCIKNLSFSKSEPELINLLSKASDLQSRLADKFAEHHRYLNVKKSIKKNENTNDLFLIF